MAGLCVRRRRDAKQDAAAAPRPFARAAARRSAAPRRLLRRLLRRISRRRALPPARHLQPRSGPLPPFAAIVRPPPTPAKTLSRAFLERVFCKRFAIALTKGRTRPM